MGVRASLDDMSFPKIKEEEVPRLELPFIEEEVSTALSDVMVIRL